VFDEYSYCIVIKQDRTAPSPIKYVEISTDASGQETGRVYVEGMSYKNAWNIIGFALRSHGLGISKEESCVVLTCRKHKATYGDIFDKLKSIGQLTQDQYDDAKRQLQERRESREAARHKLQRRILSFSGARL